MPTKVYATYRLRDDADVAAFVSWSRTVDQPRCLSTSPCLSMTVYLVQGGDANSGAFDVIEDIVVTDWGEWNTVLRSREMADVMTAWRGFVDEHSLSTAYCEVI